MNSRGATVAERIGPRAWMARLACVTVCLQLLADASAIELTHVASPIGCDVASSRTHAEGMRVSFLPTRLPPLSEDMLGIAPSGLSQSQLRGIPEAEFNYSPLPTDWLTSFESTETPIPSPSVVSETTPLELIPPIDDSPTVSALIDDPLIPPPPEPLDENGFVDLLPEPGETTTENIDDWFAPMPRRETALRVGGWGVDSSGDPTFVGMYQDLRPSLFWDIDHLSSDGRSTFLLQGTGLDRRTNDANVYYFSPLGTVDIEFDNYLHRLFHDPMTNMGDLASGEEIVHEDLNVGEDYAIRVQQLNSHVKGKLTRNLKYRVNFRLLRKVGDREAHAMQHCYDNGGDLTCHVVNQRQKIDWVTTTVEPIIEGRWGPVTVAYSRPMRTFSQNDQTVSREFGIHFPPLETEDYAVVPQNFTQSDRLRVSADISEQTHLYASLRVGDTHNDFRDTHRRFYFGDVRLTRDSLDRSRTVTLYAKMNRQRNQLPPFYVDPEGYIMTLTHTTVTNDPVFWSLDPKYGFRQPIDYTRMAVGIEGSWRPFEWENLSEGLSINGGFEFSGIDRDYAEYVIQQTGIVVDHEHTRNYTYRIGANKRWSPQWQSFLRYKGRFTTDPLYATNLYEGAPNTGLPTFINTVELGGTWVPSDQFLANVTLAYERRANYSSVAEFDEHNYPITCSLWYAPTDRFSISTGYAYYANVIDQEILFPSDDPLVDRWDRRRWGYGGQTSVMTLGTHYVCSPAVTLQAGVELVWAHNAIDPFAPWPDLPAYSEVIVNKTRYNAGLDWALNQYVSAYARYIFEDYDDESVALNGGSAHMVLLGAASTY